MIDRIARKDAMAVMAGEAPGVYAHDKAVLYGLLAKSLTIDAVRELRLPPARDFATLEHLAGAALREVAMEGYFSLDYEERALAEEIFLERDPRAMTVRRLLGGVSMYGGRRVALGALTAANREVITLRTIARETAGESSITESGLYLSGRVPRKLAFLHLYDLGVERAYREQWNAPESDAGDVYRRDAVNLDPETGLSLIVHPELDDEARRAVHGPQIGCPVTMIHGYTQEIHRLLTDAALESGLVTVS